MIGKDFFKLKARDEIFVLTLRASCHGFKCGDVLTCRQVSEPLANTEIAVLERADCGRWPMRYDEAGPEVEAGARIVGQALCLSRDLDQTGPEV